MIRFGFQPHLPIEGGVTVIVTYDKMNAWLLDKSVAYAKATLSEERANEKPQPTMYRLGLGKLE